LLILLKLLPLLLEKPLPLGTLPLPLVMLGVVETEVAGMGAAGMGAVETPLETRVLEPETLLENERVA
jgi:hypothetical protein